MTLPTLFLDKAIQSCQGFWMVYSLLPNLRIRRVINFLALFFISGVFLCLATPSAQAGLPPNWRFVTPLPQGNDMIAAWAAAPDDLFVGGPGGVIQHWDGTNWIQMTTPTTKTITAMHGLSSHDVWAVGGDAYTTNQVDRSLVMHWDGQIWTAMTPPDFSGWTYPFNAVHAVGPNDVWGTIDGGTYPVHYDGTSWQFIYFPLSAEGGFKTITSIGSNDVYFAGTHGQIAHLENGNWSLEQKKESGNFSANLLQTLWAADPQNVYAGGNWGQVYRRNPDGSWADLGLGGGLFDGFNVLQIFGTSPTDIYLLGVQSIRHFNGTSVTRTNDFAYSMRLQWYNGTAAGNCIYGVGPGGVVDEFVLDGKGGGTFSPLTAGGEASLSLSVNGAAPCGTNGLLIYGSSVYRTDTSPLVFFDGSSMHDFPVLPPEMDAQSMVNGAWAGSMEDIVVAWDNCLTFGRGVTHWNGSVWEAMGDTWNQPADAIAFWRSPSGKLFACGPYHVMQWDGTNAWSQIYVLSDEEIQQTALTTIWGRSDSEVYIGEKNGKILRFDGLTWQTENTPGPGVIKGINGNSSDVYAVGENALVWKRVNGSWQAVGGLEQREGDNFTQIISGPDGVYAVQSTPSMYTGGGMGLVWRFNGATATLVMKGLSKPLDLFGSFGGHLYGISAQSTIITDESAPAGFAQQRFDLSSTNWASIGTSGVELRSPSSIVGRPMVGAWHVDKTPTFFASAVPGVACARQTWFIRQDTFYSGSAVPNVQVRLHYDPSKLPVGFAADTARLYRFDGKTWNAVAAVVDAAAQTITSQAPTGLSEWTLGSIQSTALPALVASRVGPQQLSISWPVSTDAVQLEATENLESSHWLTVTNAITIANGTNQVLLETSQDSQFYRLRKMP